MASSATPLHDSLIELAIPDAHAHAIKWYLNRLFAKLTRFLTYRFVQEGFLQELQRLLIMRSPSHAASADDPVPNVLILQQFYLWVWLIKVGVAANFSRALTRA